jgi:hypothetical protein
LHARLISDCQNSAIVGRWNPVGPGVRQHPIAINLPVLESGNIWPCRQMPTDQIPIETGRNISGFRPWSEANLIWMDPATTLAKTAKIRLESSILVGSGQTCLLESSNGDRTLSNSGGICQTLIFAFRNFFVRAKRWNIFLKKSFFLKMISPKIFYNVNHFTSKQAKHKLKWLAQFLIRISCNLVIRISRNLDSFIEREAVRQRPTFLLRATWGNKR